MKIEGFSSSSLFCSWYDFQMENGTEKRAWRENIMTRETKKTYLKEWLQFYGFFLSSNSNSSQTNISQSHTIQ